MAQYRAARLGHAIQQLVAEMIQLELRDPRVQLATITRAEVSGDLRHARIYVSAMTDEERAQAVQALQRARGLLRSRLAARLSLRTTPDLQFVADTAIAGGDRVLGMLRQLEASDAGAGSE